MLVPGEQQHGDLPGGVGLKAIDVGVAGRDGRPQCGAVRAVERGGGRGEGFRAILGFRAVFNGDLWVCEEVVVPGGVGAGSAVGGDDGVAAVSEWVAGEWCDALDAGPGRRGDGEGSSGCRRGPRRHVRRSPEILR